MTPLPRPESFTAAKLPEHQPAAQTRPQLTVVIPTYCEAENISPVIDALTAALAGLRWEVIFVDDDSPDGTADVVRARGVDDGRVRVLRRIGRRGLAGAVIEGMLAATADTIAVMDCDLQHDET